MHHSARDERGKGPALLWIGGLLVPAALLVITFLALTTLTAVTRDALDLWSRRLAEAVADNLAHVTGTVGESLAAIADDYRRDPAATLSRASDPMVARMVAMPHTPSVPSFFDAAGRPIGGGVATSAAAGMAASPLFRTLGDGARGLAIGAVPNGGILIGRRLEDASGGFAGAVAAEIPLGEVLRSFSALNLGADGAISVLGDDGSAIATARATAGEAGTGERLTAEATAPVAGTSLAVAVRMSTGPLYARLRQASWRVGAVVSVLCVGLAVVSLLLRRELRRRWLVEQKLARLVVIDPLTGLLNRRGFEERVAREWRRLRAEDGALALLVVDADHFKAFNDRLGHPAGDEALRSLAELLEDAAAVVRGLAARFGGEEFIVVLPGVGLEEARDRAEGIRAAVAASFRETAFTVSIGGSWGRPGALSRWPSLFEAADAALYEAKRSGRDRVVFRQPAAAGGPVTASVGKGADGDAGEDRGPEAGENAPASVADASRPPGSTEAPLGSRP